MRLLQTSVVGSLVAAMCLVCGGIASGADKLWIGDSTGNWVTDTAWTGLTAPNGGDRAFISNGATVTIDVNTTGGAVCNRFYLGVSTDLVTNGTGHLVVNSGGTLDVVGAAAYLGYNKAGTLNANVSTVTLNTGGSMTFEDGAQLEIGAWASNGYFYQNGGTIYNNDAAGGGVFGDGAFYVGAYGTGKYYLNSGILNSPWTNIGYGGDPSWSGLNQPRGTGWFYQNGGVHNTPQITVGGGWDYGGEGFYEMNAGTANVTYITLGQIDAGWATHKASDPTGTFTQNGGMVLVTSGVYIGCAASSYGNIGPDSYGVGTYNFYGGTLTDSAGAAFLHVREGALGLGTFQGHGVVDFHGALVNNGQVIADGGTLDMSSFASVANTVANTGNNGWFATNGGKLMLPPVNVATGTNTYTWGGYGSSNLVNSLQLTMNNVTAGGSASIALLAGTNSELPALGNGTVVGAWKVTPPGGFTFDSADLTVRYDDSKVPLSWLTDSLQVLGYNAGQWADVTTGTANSVTKQITANGLTAAGTFAVFLPNQWLLSGSGSSDDANWVTGVMPNGLGLAANFLKAITAPSTVTATASVTFGAINFNNTNSYTLAGTAAVTLQTSTGAAQINVLAGNHTISAPVLLASPLSVNPSGGNLEMAGNITGTGTLTKTGSGALLISAPSTFGGLTVNAGTLTLSAANTFGGLTAVNGGTLTLADSQALQNSVLQPSGSGAVTFGTLAAATLGGLQGSGQLSVAVNLSVGNDNASTTFSGLLNGGGTLNKIGSGTLTLTNPDNSQSYLTLSSGAVSVSNEGSLGASSRLNFNGGLLRITGTAMTGFSSGRSLAVNWGTFNGGFDIVDSAATFTVSNTIGGEGGLVKTGSGTLVLAGISNSISAFTGGTTVEAGVLQVGNAGYIGGLGGLDNQSGDAVVRAGATLRFANFIDQAYSGQISGSGSVVKTGDGMLTLSGTDTYTGGTTVLGGILDLESVAALPSNSTLAIANSAEVIFATDLGLAIQLSLMLPGASGGGDPGLTYFRVVSSAPASVPEPGTLALLSAAALAATVAWRRRRKTAI
jgi:fibronectin-binding autotransporter adhesin